jgi:ADP-heptose:LPS heptosyltransferase
MSDRRWKTRSLYLNSSEEAGSDQAGFKRVLVIRIGRLGDTILATPVIEVLQRHFAGQVLVDFVTSAGASAFILSLDKRINRVFPVSRRHLPWRLNTSKREIEKHSSESPYDLVINLECGTECDDFIKFVHHSEFCGRPLIAPQHSSNRHCVDTEKSIYADLLGAKNTAAAETSLQMEDQGQVLPVSASEDFVVLNPGFSGVGDSGYSSHRGWPLAHWQNLINMIHQQLGIPVLINGTTEEGLHFSSLLDLAGVQSLFGSSLPTLAAALRNARCLVSVDTGTMHLAAALKTPVVALFGPGIPKLTGPYSRKGLHRILTSKVDCQPCVRTPEQKKCSFNRCMSELQPEKVFKDIQSLIVH